MRKWFRRFLLSALIALPSAAQAQYPQGYYWQPGYPAPYPNYPQTPYVAPAYYQQAPAPGYYQQAPVRPVMPAVPQGTSPYASRASDWDLPVTPVQPVRQVQAVAPVQPPRQAPAAPTLLPQPAVLPAIGAVKASNAGDAPVRPVAKSALPASEDVQTPAAAPKKDPVGEPAPVEKATTPLILPREVTPPIEKTPVTGFVVPESEKVTIPTKPAREVMLPTVKTPVTETVMPAPTQAPATTEVYAAPPVMISDHGNCRDSRLSVFADYLLWNVHGADVPFAQAFDGVVPALSAPRGPVGVVSPDFKSGFRVGGGVDNPGGISVFGTFTYFFTERSASIAAPDGFVLHNFLAFPIPVVAAPVGLTASANYKIRLLMADIDAKCDIINNDCFRLNWLAGVRYAHNDQDVSSTFEVPGVTTVDSRIRFDAFGPRFGLEGRYRTKCGIFGYANGIVDVLIGQYRGAYEQRNDLGGLIGFTSITSNRVVPVLEFELGGGWESSNGRVRVSGGYYVGTWFNSMNTTSFASAVGNTNFTTNGNNFRDNLVFDGLVVRFEFRY